MAKQAIPLPLTDLQKEILWIKVTANMRRQEEARVKAFEHAIYLEGLQGLGWVVFTGLILTAVNILYTM